MMINNYICSNRCPELDYYGQCHCKSTHPDDYKCCVGRVAKFVLESNYNRKIFRGKCDSGWEYGSLIIALDGSQLISDRGSSSSVVDPSTVGQYIGAEDNNFTMIYEGDIIRMITSSGDTRELIVPPLIVVSTIANILESTNRVILGNTTDNPKLVNELLLRG